MKPEDIPQPVMVGDDPETETFAGQYDVTKKNGVKAVIKFTFEYPKGEGMVLWKVLSDFQIPDQAIFEHLMETGDASLLVRASEMSNDEDDYDYDEDED